MKTNKKNIVVFTGAGVSAESGVDTFRSNGGLWGKHKVEDVADIKGWERDPTLVLDFYNHRRRELKTVEPNTAHKLIAELEKDYNVTVVTQNVDNLHERAGSTNIIHLHGELNKSRSSNSKKIIYDCDGDINIGDKCELGSQLRPNVVWFGETLNDDDIKYSIDAVIKSDIVIIVGTSMSVYPASSIPFYASKVYYVDPADVNMAIPHGVEFIHIQEIASVGMSQLIPKL